jgi:hypothetical protein
MVLWHDNHKTIGLKHPESDDLAEFQEFHSLSAVLSATSKHL